ncbi:hypothetical protein N7512_003523 [Penicillium capsulatum]|nr:hypothetical protein N7512_003523 [Penicillium capsulatum]
MDAINKRYPLAVILPTVSFIELAICVPPLILHAKNRNFPAASFICWSMLLNIFNIINALIWPTDDIESWWDGTGLCDVEVKLMVAGYVAVPGSILCIFRGLAQVMDTSRATLVPSKTQRWRNWVVDLMFCAIIPMIAMMLHYVWQKSRYLLFAISGCVNDFDESWPSMVLANMWPLPICLGAGYYCCLLLFRLYKYRSDFESILRASRSNLSKSRFLRLFFLAFVTLITILPAEAYILYYDVAVSLPWHPYSWSQIHGPKWYVIQRYPTQGQVFFDRYLPIAMGLMIFVFFGFGRDATRMYRTALWYLGLGSCFPGLNRPVDSQATPRPANVSAATTLVESTTSRAKQFFNRARKRSSRNWFGTSSYNDIEKGGLSSQSNHDIRVHRTPWYLSPWTLFSRRRASALERGVLLDDISAPSQTIHTNAWAGSSQSRNSSDLAPSVTLPKWNDSIHVKRVICQQSEMQV